MHLFNEIVVVGERITDSDFIRWETIGKRLGRSDEEIEQEIHAMLRRRSTRFDHEN